MSKPDLKGCLELALERMRYFTGRFMTARDFRDEQAYHLTHRLLHNRMLHGWGVICGLHVHAHPSPDCRQDHVRVSAGMAVDCCGREIVVQHSLVPPPIPWKEKPNDAKQSADQGDDDDEDRRYYPLLCLTYEEKLTEQVPVLYSEGNCDEQRREYSRVQEGYQFNWVWVRRRDLLKYHWRVRGGGCRHEDEQDERVQTVGCRKGRRTSSSATGRSTAGRLQGKARGASVSRRRLRFRQRALSKLPRTRLPAAPLRPDCVGTRAPAHAGRR